ncbi:MAG: hypothetical protein ABIP68_01840, partial [Ferruginibacter sp.]
MLFNIISDEPIHNLFNNSHSKIKLYSTFTNAVKLSSPSFLENKINESEFWTEDINEFIKNYLVDELSKFKITPLTSIEDFDFSIELDNEFLCLKDKNIFILDKRIAMYFNMVNTLPSNKIDFELLLKTRGILNVSFKEIINQLKTYFNSDYKYYIPLLFHLLSEQKEVYKSTLFEDILFSKNYLENVKIYNIESDFVLRKDIKGLYIQSEYTEYITGRL